ncbi:hypothetical protein PS9374_07044 [Planomonospora sphaerica]|uniref:Uncharacterized protein n=1 Tax=Planomonospora sphaerica TaxID=161355 RepID=A0A161MFR3_9ACTN|nr:hypothetical protein [Planomonospora sphaerica]GAT71353.1 hypothetical protein PS9374_07044 [Planomonospora sphaerica]
MNDTDEVISQLARVRDAELAGQASTTGARTLLAAITAVRPDTAAPPSPADGRRWRMRLMAAAAVVSVLATGVVIGPSLLGDRSAVSYANSAVVIVRDGDQYVARITDPFADHARYSEAFHAVGLDIDLRPVPVSPGAVGQILGMVIGGDQVPDPRTEPDPSGPRFGGVALSTETAPKGCRPGRDSGCVMVVRIPVGFTGHVNVRLGRQARPGEQYANADQAMDPGEMFAGVSLRHGRSVRDVVAEARRRDLHAVFSLIRIDARTGGLSFDPVPADRVERDWVVWHAWQVRAGVIRFLVTPERLADNPFHNGSAPPPAS